MAFNAFEVVLANLATNPSLSFLDSCAVAARLALAGCLGPPRDHQEIMTTFWEAVAEDGSRAPRTLKTIAALKAAAREAGLPITANAKKAELAACVPRTVPPSVVRRARELRAEEEAQAAADAVDQDAHITASRAKSEWHLSEGDLQELPCSEAPNPHYRSAAPMRLYLLRDVVEASLLKFGGEAGLKRRSAAAEATAAKRRKTATDVVDARRAALAAALAAHGLQVRPDSRLCQEHIYSGRHAVADVVRSMAEMAFFFAHTEYDTIRGELYEAAWEMVHEARRAGVIEDAPDGDEVSAKAKRKALTGYVRRVGGAEAALARPELPASLRSRLPPPRARRSRRQLRARRQLKWRCRSRRQ